MSLGVSTLERWFASEGRGWGEGGEKEGRGRGEGGEKEGRGRGEGGEREGRGRGEGGERGREREGGREATLGILKGSLRGVHGPAGGSRSSECARGGLKEPTPLGCCLNYYTGQAIYNYQSQNQNCLEAVPKLTLNLPLNS